MRTRRGASLPIRTTFAQLCEVRARRGRVLQLPLCLSNCVLRQDLQDKQDLDAWADRDNHAITHSTLITQLHSYYFLKQDYPQSYRTPPLFIDCGHLSYAFIWSLTGKNTIIFDISIDSSSILTTNGNVSNSVHYGTLPIRRQLS